MGNSMIGYVESARGEKTFYPTPLPLIQKMLEGIKWQYIGSVLEPSGGKGDIAQYVGENLYYAHRSYPCWDEHSRREAVERQTLIALKLILFSETCWRARAFV